MTKALPADYEPAEFDVVFGRGRRCFEHSGNRRLHEIIETHLDEYTTASRKSKKTSIANFIVKRVYEKGIFVKQHPETGKWFEVGWSKAKEKVGHAIRETVANQHRESRNVSFSREDDDMAKLLEIQRKIFRDMKARSDIEWERAQAEQQLRNVYQHQVALGWTDNRNDEQRET
eukprot:CAMPEP_0185731228 /NCGR_PEP_ID=MMETSP1171-20130828/12292_1 /TAXON_ID=374046 /ORGANISM="Helicotheca tamensis, Strain CCMP826" /LENGTH=173 /DNA_ID=CAMNT_0028400451 /DNA_START=89 /DNA_END=610 /DNA_ORIENTATION=+